MDIYNITVSAIINVLLLLILEGVIFFIILKVVFGNLFDSLINILGSNVNQQLIKQKNIILQLLQPQLKDNDNPEFISQAFKLYSIGKLDDNISTEKDYIENNDVRSFITYTILFYIFIGLLIIVKLINYFGFNNIFTIEWKKIILNLGIVLLLFGIFMIPIILIIVLNIGNNIDFNKIFYNILEKIKISYGNSNN